MTFRKLAWNPKQTFVRFLPRQNIVAVSKREGIFDFTKRNLLSEWHTLARINDDLFLGVSIA
jgi:hypothetical protein